MRYAEGLAEYTRNASLFIWDSTAKTVTDEFGKKFKDDKLIVKYNGKEVPIFSCNEFSREQAMAIELKI